MNDRIALLLKDRISQFTYVGKLAGMVQTVTKLREGKEVKIPVGVDVDDALGCTDSTLLDMIPDSKYAAMVYFEDRGYQRVQSRTRGISFTGRIRLVCWVNTNRLGGDPHAADKMVQEFIGAIESGIYNSDTLIGILHRVEGVPQRGSNIFSEYTYPESTRQYLMLPYAAFAFDILTRWRIRPGCEEQVAESAPGCWTPPTTKKRKNPSEFSCDELNDPVTGLTDAQKEDCLDCSGGGLTECEVLAAITEPLTVAPCVTDEMAIAMGSQFISRDAYTADIIVEQIGNAGKSSDVRALLCPALCDTLGGVAEEDVITDVYNCLSPEAQAALQTFLAVATFIYYDTEADALADTTTEPSMQQRVVLLDTGREYAGQGATVTVADLINAKKFMIPVTETTKGINTTVVGESVGISLTDPT